MLVIASTSSRLPTAQPIRKPVIAYIFETPWTTTSREASPVSFANSYGFGAFWPSKTSRLYRSSMISQRFFFSQNATISAMNSAGYITPDGLFGLLRITAFVYEPTLSAMSGTEGWKLPSSGTTGTATPPASFTISG